MPYLKMVHIKDCLIPIRQAPSVKHTHNYSNKTKEMPNGAASKSKMSWKRNIQDYISTKDFKRELVRNFPNFRGYEQHDAQEFLTSLLDIMSKELNRVKIKPKYKELKISSKESIQKQAEKWADYYKEREDSYITDFFQGQTMNELKCQK